jgi:hypothetical protein
VKGSNFTMNKKSIFSLAMASLVLLSSCNAGFSASADNPTKGAKQATPNASEPEASAQSDELPGQAPETHASEMQPQPMPREDAQPTKDGEAPTAPTDLPSVPATEAQDWTHDPRYSDQRLLIPDSEVERALTSGERAGVDIPQIIIDACRRQGNAKEFLSKYFPVEEPALPPGDEISNVFEWWIAPKETGITVQPGLDKAFDPARDPYNALSVILRLANVEEHVIEITMFELMNVQKRRNECGPEATVAHGKIEHARAYIAQAIENKHRFFQGGNLDNLAKWASRVVNSMRTIPPVLEDHQRLTFGRARFWADTHPPVAIKDVVRNMRIFTQGSEFEDVYASLPADIYVMAELMNLHTTDSRLGRGMTDLLQACGHDIQICGEPAKAMWGRGSEQSDCISLWICRGQGLIVELTSENPNIAGDDIPQDPGSEIDYLRYRSWLFNYQGE